MPLYEIKETEVTMRNGHVTTVLWLAKNDYGTARVMAGRMNAGKVLHESAIVLIYRDGTIRLPRFVAADVGLCLDPGDGNRVIQRVDKEAGG